MSKEKFGQKKQSSPISAKVAYALLLENGYTPKLVNTEKPLHSQNWESVINHQNVAHSKSGKSIIMADSTDNNRPPVDLKIKGMMGENGVEFFQSRVGIQMKPSL